MYNNCLNPTRQLSQNLLLATLGQVLRQILARGLSTRYIDIEEVKKLKVQYEYFTDSIIRNHF